MKFKLLTSISILTPFTISALHAEQPTMNIDSPQEWKEKIQSSVGAVIKDGSLSPKGKTATLTTKLQTFDTKRSATSLTINQSPIWQNWNPVPNIGPSNLRDAPVLLTMGPDNYWIFGGLKTKNKKSKKSRKSKKSKGSKKTTAPSTFQPEAATLDGFDIPLLTTPFEDQFTAPGGLKKDTGGYHAWQSRDMKTWVHHGPVTEKSSRWVTNAEMVDGKALIYFDFPNDQDPHVYVDSDLTDGEPGENKGKVLEDPSHGSDAGFIRDLDGNFHAIFEDWSPISADKRSWDSPLAGHAVSPDGISPFKILSPAVDNRTKPTGKIATFKHPSWVKEDPANYKTSIAEYEIHEPEQEAYGDWAAIAIGGQYYLFGDYDPVGGHEMSTGWFTSSSIDKQFTWCDHIGNGHPDPDVAFAEGQFYLATQQKTDYTSPGPWVETVEARVGVDTDNDAKIDQWTEWSELKESYDYIPGFSKQIKKTPAQLDTSSLPEGYGFQIEMKITDSTENKSKPIIESIQLSFK